VGYGEFTRQLLLLYLPTRTVQVLEKQIPDNPG